MPGCVNVKVHVFVDDKGNVVDQYVTDPQNETLEIFRDTTLSCTCRRCGATINLDNTDSTSEQSEIYDRIFDTVKCFGFC